MNLDFLKLCLVTHRQDQSIEHYLDFIIKSVQGGVTSVQFRDKNASLETQFEMAFALKKRLTPYQVPLIINDHLELAKAVGAEGIHLGQSDISPLIARATLGPDVKIGLSVESEAQLVQANQLDCIDYIAASAVFNSTTKKDCAHIWGLSGLKQVCNKSVHPVVAIGGIQTDNVALVMQCGIAGIAVVGAIHQAIDPAAAAAQLIHLMESP